MIGKSVYIDVTLEAVQHFNKNDPRSGRIKIKPNFIILLFQLHQFLVKGQSLPNRIWVTALIITTQLLPLFYIFSNFSISSIRHYNLCLLLHLFPIVKSPCLFDGCRILIIIFYGIFFFDVFFFFNFIVFIFGDIIFFIFLGGDDFIDIWSHTFIISIYLLLLLLLLLLFLYLLQSGGFNLLLPLSTIPQNNRPYPRFKLFLPTLFFLIAGFDSLLE